MVNIEPTYLRYVYDNIKKGILNAENAAALPKGFIEIYDSEFSEKTPVNKRQESLNQLALWALFKGPVSLTLAASILGSKEEDVKDLIDNYSNWFNSPETGRYQLYHERIKMYLLSKLSNKEIQYLSSKVIYLLKSDRYQTVEFNNYKYQYYVDHLIAHSYESGEYKKELDKVIYEDHFWNSSFSILKSIQPAIDNLRNLISFSVFKKDWKLIHQATRIILNLEQKNDNLCEQILKSKTVELEQIIFCFSSISSPFDSLRFLWLITLKLGSKENKNELLEDPQFSNMWNKIINYIESEYINGSLLTPFWAKKELDKISRTFQIEPLIKTLDELDFDDLQPIAEREIEFIYVIDELEEHTSRDLETYYKLSNTLENKIDDFDRVFKLIDTPNLMVRDELLCRATLNYIEKSHQDSYSWLYWLLVKSDFEVGEHVFADEMYFTKNLIGKIIQASDLLYLDKVEKLVNDIDLNKDIKLELRCWISDKYFQLNNKTRASDVLNIFNYPIESTFDPSVWKGAWLVEKDIDFDIRLLKISHRLNAILKSPDRIAKLSIDALDEFLNDLQKDKISKAEYLTEAAVRIYHSRKNLATEIIDNAWNLIGNTSDWGSVFVKVEILVGALNFMPRDWIKQKIADFEYEYIKALETEDFIEEALQNFYNYHPFRFSDKNALKLTLKNKSAREFLYRVDKIGLEDAIKNEQTEKKIIEAASNSKSFREFWSAMKIFFKSEGCGIHMENFWALFNDNEIIFKTITAEDVRIISVISGKVSQHFPLKDHLEKSQKLQLYQDRIPIPDDWEYGSVVGFIAMLSDKTLEKVTVCNAILNRPRNGNELTETSINAIGYMLLEIVKNKEQVKKINTLLELRNEVLNSYA